MIGVICVAFFAKFIAGAAAARLNGLVWRESFTIGSLMSCKGLVELIVLNIGLQAKILSQRTFTIFVVMALVTTFATTPITAALYPPWYQRKLEAWKRGEIDWDTGAPLLDGRSEAAVDEIIKEKLESSRINNLLIYLRLDAMPTTLALVSLLSGKPSDSIPKRHPAQINDDLQSGIAQQSESKRPIEVHGLRLVELTERGSTVMKVSEMDEYSAFDPVLNAFRVMGQIYNLLVSGEVSIIPQSSYAETLVTRAADESSDLLLVPWSETGSMSEEQTITRDSVRHKLASDSYGSFVTQALNSASCNAAVFINKGFSGTLKQQHAALNRRLSTVSLKSSHRDHSSAIRADRSHHIFMPYFGGGDGRVALRLVMQLAEHPEITATVVHFRGVEHETVTANKDSENQLSLQHSIESDAAFFATIQRSLPAEIQHRVVLDTAASSSTLKDAIAKAQTEVGQNPKNGGDIIIVARDVVRKDADGGCLGSVADAILDANLRASLLVVQGRRGTNE